MHHHRSTIKNTLGAALVILLQCGIFAEEISFRADRMTGTAGKKSETTTLIGDAFVRTASMEISADRIELSGKDFRYISASGNVRGINTESALDFTCKDMLYDRRTKVATLRNSVSMLDTANDVTVRAQLIEYNQTSDIADIQIDVDIRQKDNICTGGMAVYDKGRQTLKLTGNPKLVQNEDTFRAQEIMLNLDTQEITLDGRVSGTVTDTKEEKAQETVTEETALEKEEEYAPEEAEDEAQ